MSGIGDLIMVCKNALALNGIKGQRYGVLSVLVVSKRMIQPNIESTKPLTPKRAVALKKTNLITRLASDNS